MEITAAEAIPVSIPLKSPFRFASGELTHCNQVFVRLTDEAGNVGWGETTTFHAVYGYDQKSVCNVLKDYLLPAVIGSNAAKIGLLHQRMDAAIPFNLPAKCGVDLALWDLLGRATKSPICDLIGGNRVDTVPLVGVVGIVPTEKAVGLASNLVDAGFATIKIKTGLRPLEDLQRVSVIRHALGPEIALRIDANGGYDRSTALAILPKFEPLGLEWIEQPLPAWDWQGSALLAARLDTPIALDESIYTFHDAQHAIALGAADVVNIKLQKCGGIFRSQQIAAVCESAGVPCFLGGCLELAPGYAAMAHFYAATSNVVSAIEAVPGFCVDDVCSSLPIVENGGIKVPDGSGVGVDIDKRQLDRYRLDI